LNGKTQEQRVQANHEGLSCKRLAAERGLGFTIPGEVSLFTKHKRIEIFCSFLVVSPTTLLPGSLTTLPCHHHHHHHHYYYYYYY